MALTQKQLSLGRGLQDCGLRELPRPWDSNGGEVWITALALVRRVTGREDYVLVENTKGDGAPRVTKDYNPTSAIAAFIRIYPVERLERRFKPDVRSQKQVREFLVKRGHDITKIASLQQTDGKSEKRIAEDKAELLRLVNAEAIREAKATLAEERRCRNIGIIKNEDNE